LGFSGGAFEIQREQALQDFVVHGAIEILPGLAQAFLIGFELRVSFRGEIVERTAFRLFPDFNEIVPAVGGGDSASLNVFALLRKCGTTNASSFWKPSRFCSTI
jgi:hypothetical protein